MKTKKTVELRRYIAEFKTTDGEIHKFSRYRFANPKAIICTIPEYIMVDVKSDGYMTDDDGIMYPLSNVVSIKWIPTDEPATAHDNGRVFYGMDELIEWGKSDGES